MHAGLNVNRGMKICLRLRYPGDRNQFLPIENVVDTMLHELSHIVHGPHNQQFHALWDQLRDECQGLMMKGYTGEGFLSEGRRLGGARMPDREARRLAREAAEKRRSQPFGTASGQRLGGAAARPGQNIRQVIASAAQRRNAVLQGCGTERFNDLQIREIADTATRNGFRTQAEEDEANEIAIAQAMWELVQDDERVKYGQSYIPPSAEHPEGNGGGSLLSQQADVSASSNAALQSRANVAIVNKVDQQADMDLTSPLPSEPSAFWICGVCTLHNPQQYLCCEACGSERGQNKRQKGIDNARDSAGKSNINKPAPGRTPPTTIDLTESPPRKKRANASEKENRKEAVKSSIPPPPAVWTCTFCGEVMERQWWTCSMCGKMKDSSK